MQTPTSLGGSKIGAQCRKYCSVMCVRGHPFRGSREVSVARHHYQPRKLIIFRLETKSSKGYLFVHRFLSFMVSSMRKTVIQVLGTNRGAIKLTDNLRTIEAHLLGVHHFLRGVINEKTIIEIEHNLGCSMLASPQSFWRQRFSS